MMLCKAKLFHTSLFIRSYNPYCEQLASFRTQVFILKRIQLLFRTAQMCRLKQSLRSMLQLKL